MGSNAPAPWAVIGTFVHAPVYGDLEIATERCLVISGEGTITAIAPASQAESVLAQHGVNPSSVLRLQEGQLLAPGFVDTHCHAPQYSYTGTATDKPLMQWLQDYTFPRESGMKDMEAAASLYQSLVARLLRNGTTTALYFASLHLAPSLTLARVCAHAGQRAFIGKVCMDRNSPDSYVETAADGIRDTEALIEALHGDKLVRPVITPRFVPSCTPEMMEGLGKLAARHPEVVVQSHISESHDAVAFSAALHPEVDGRDIRLFEAAGLLTSPAVFAHGVCLTDDELRLMAERGSAIAHCPLSNFFFADRLLRVNDAKKLGVKIGLGTDVAGGYSPSMLSALRSAVVTSKALRMQHLQPAEHGTEPSPANSHLLDYKGAFHLATVGGAEALGIQDSVGTFAVGKAFDALLLELDSGVTFDVYPTDSVEDRFQKLCNLGDDRNIAKVWVQGRCVVPVQP